MLQGVAIIVSTIIITVYILTYNLLDNNGSISIIEILHITGLTSSKSEARRLVIQRAVKVDEVTIDEPLAKIQIYDGQVLKAGKRKFVKIKVE